MGRHLSIPLLGIGFFLTDFQQRDIVVVARQISERLDDRAERLGAHVLNNKGNADWIHKTHCFQP